MCNYIHTVAHITIRIIIHDRNGYNAGLHLHNDYGVDYLMFQTPVVCRPLEHQKCPIHHHRLFPIHHFYTLQLSPHTVLSHQSDEHRHNCKL